MTASNSSARRRGSDRGDYGFARARDLAFDAVSSLWRRRRAAGVKQRDIAKILNRDRGWVSKQFRGPGNWTLRIVGELIEAMDGELSIAAFGLEDQITPVRNFDAYAEYGPTPVATAVTVGAVQIAGNANDRITKSLTSVTSTAVTAVSWASMTSSLELIQ
jgi:hypothetical protein